MLSDLEIAQQTELTPITEIAPKSGIKEDELILHGKYKAKVKADILNRLTDHP